MGSVNYFANACDASANLLLYSAHTNSECAAKLLHVCTLSHKCYPSSLNTAPLYTNFYSQFCTYFTLRRTATMDLCSFCVPHAFAQLGRIQNIRVTRGGAYGRSTRGNLEALPGGGELGERPTKREGRSSLSPPLRRPLGRRRQRRLRPRGG